MPRAVDAAMAEDRPEKGTVRNLWADEIERVRDRSGPGLEPLFLTLCGAATFDIDVLLERGIVEVTEVGGIATKDARAVVAVESNQDAVVEIVRKYPGLKVLDKPIRDILQSESELAWPARETRVFCRAGVVNLDLDESLQASVAGGQITFPVLEWIRKFAVLHAQPPRFDWSLCLTLHGEISWEDPVAQAMQAFLAENFGESSAFADGCRDLFGETMYGRIEAKELDFATLNRPQQQKLLMALVPKRISHLTARGGWLVRTTRNLRYGGHGKYAPMVTWIMEFISDERASAQPLETYRESLDSVLASAGAILADGNIE